jgi:hypothetical protein
MILRLAVTVAILAGLTPASRAADCPAPDRRPQLEVIIDDGSIAYDFTRTRSQMTEVPRELGATPPNHGHDPQGLTFAKLTLSRPRCAIATFAVAIVASIPIASS